MRNQRNGNRQGRGNGRCMGLKDGSGAGKFVGGANRNTEDCQGNGEGHGLGEGRGKANNRSFLGRFFEKK
ncbi:MAG: hypothetical protein KU29_10345 [Sulfurovum sp. FS06-10]|nr:MAG: hypothetical protein KU29_10345 [Sulfurovum sp. FS06-10]